MLKSFSDDRLKLMPGSQEIRRVFFEKGLEQYAQILGERQDDAAVKARMAYNYQELGLLRSEIGAVEEARQALRKAVDMRRQLAVTAKEDAASQAALGHALFQLGQFLWEQQQLKEVAAPVQESVDIFSRLHDRFPQEPAYKAALGRVLTRLASVKSEAGGEKTLRRALDLLRDAARALPNDADVLTDLARALNNLAGEIPAERVTDRLVLFEEACQTAGKALKLNPVHSVAQTIWAMAVKNRASTLAGAGRADEARRILQQAISDCKAFTGKNPAVIKGYLSQTLLQTDLAASFQRSGNYDQAKEVWEDIARVNEGLCQRDPQNPQYYIESIDAYLSTADIDRNTKREAEAAVIFDKIIKQAEPIMRRYPTSDDLLRRLIYTHWTRGELSLDVEQYDKAREVYQGGVDLFTRYAPSVASPGEVTHYNYFHCCRSLLQIARERKETEAAIALAMKLIVPIKPDTFTNGGYKQELIWEWINLSGLYEDTGNVKEAIRLRVQATEAAKTILGGDRKSNWYAYQMVFGGYQHLARLYRKDGDQRHEFEALRNHLKETDPYVHERDHSTLLAETADFTPQNLSRLRDEFAKFVNEGGMKRFTIPTDFGGVKCPFNVYVADSWEFLEDQFTWVEKVRGGKVPREVVDSFRRLYTIAKDNKVSYQDLCVYALGTDKGTKSGKTDNDNPIAPSGSATDVNVTLQELAAGRQGIQAGKGGPEAKRRLALKYIHLAEDEIAASNYFRAEYLLAEVRGYLGLDSFDRLQDPTNNDLYSYFQLVEGALLACTGKPEKGYTEVLCSMQTEPENVTPEFAVPNGNSEFAMGWICLKLKRPIESATCYHKAMELGHPFAAGWLYLVWQEHPETTQFLPEDLRKLLTRAKTSVTKHETGPAAFVRLLAEAQAQASRETALQAEKRRQERFTQFQELADLYHELADTYQTQNKRDQYRKALSKEFKARDWVMTLVPDNIESSQAAGEVAAKLAQSYVDTKEAEAAVEWLTKAANYGDVRVLVSARGLVREGYEPQGRSQEGRALSLSGVVLSWRVLLSGRPLRRRPARSEDNQ